VGGGELRATRDWVGQSQTANLIERLRRGCAQCQGMTSSVYPLSNLMGARQVCTYRPQSRFNLKHCPHPQQNSFLDPKSHDPVKMRHYKFIHFSHLLAVALAATLPQKAQSKSMVPLVITNRCSDTIWPAVHTNDGQGPKSQGFELSAGSTQNFTVNTDWNGRIWGRTNCTFDSKGFGSCGTGDCGGNLTCTLTVSFPSQCRTIATTNSNTCLIFTRVRRLRLQSSTCLDT
jgi:hypothetical protein